VSFDALNRPVAKKSLPARGQAFLGVSYVATGGGLARKPISERRKINRRRVLGVVVSCGDHFLQQVEDPRSPMNEKTVIRVVLDTSVLVAAARSLNGAAYAIVSRLPEGAFIPAISVSLFEEYRELLLRPEHRLNRSTHQVEAFLDNLVAFAHLQEVFFLWRPTLPDPDDDLVLEVAVAAGCKYIVTHNLRHFRGVDRAEFDFPAGDL